MFTRVSLVLAALVAATAITTACPPPLLDDLPLPLKKPEAAPFPHVGTIVALDGKTETVEYTVVVPVLVRERILDWPQLLEREPRARFVYRWQHKKVTRTSKIDRLKFTDVTGKPIPTLDAWKRLEIGTTFFVSADGNPVSAAHLKMLAPDALVAVDADNVLMERIFQELELSGIDQGIEKPLPYPGPKPRPLPLPFPLPELRPELP